MYRRKFTREFKEAAVRKLQLGKTEREVAQACRVNHWILRRWQREYENFGARAFGGYGKSRHVRKEPRSRAITLYLSSDEFEAVKAASSAAGFRSLAEFGRSCIFCPTSGPPLEQVKDVLEELAVVVRKLSERLSNSK
jgi:transposase-like protein